MPLLKHPGLAGADDVFLLIQKMLLYSLPLLAAIGIAGPLALRQNNFALLGSYLAIPMLLSSLMFLRCKSKGKDRESRLGICPERREFDRRTFFFSLSLYFVIYILSLFLLQKFPVRPFAYYALITLMTGLILLNILFFKLERAAVSIILFQCMLLVLNIIWGVNLNYYFFIGRTDAIGHAWIIEDMLRHGHVTELFELYKPFPLWHILVSSLYTATGIHIPVHRAMFFASGLIYSFMIPLIYLGSMKIFNSQRLSLLSALFMVIYSDIIFYGMYAISRSIVSFLEILLILLLLKRGRPEIAVLYIVTIFSIILFHTASMPFVILIFFAIWLLQTALNIEKEHFFLTTYCLMLMIVSTLFYWMFLAEDLFRAITSSIFSPPPAGVLPGSFIDMPLNELFNYLQYSPILFLALVGTLISLQSKRISNGNKVLFLTGLLLIPVTFPGPSLLLSKLASSFNLARFSEYSFILILIASALGFKSLFSSSGKYGRALFILLFVFMSFLSISNDFIASDNPLVKRPFYTYYLTEEEVTGLNHFAAMTKGYMMSDYVASNFIFNSPYILKEHILEVDAANMTLLRNSSEDTILIRSGELEKRPLYLYTAMDGRLRLEPNLISSCEYYYRDLPLWGSLNSYNQVFDSNRLKGFN